ncbi:MAG: 4Fe-4S ferredoxin [Chloroflexi bacterium CG07_land_8_20_14_0_80_45_17]|nr:MAG: 4Fe-4S ferredoxin [Chloroflexi bacterium CG23_combo_of_CG06-09_8_20_14_all_45_10]PIU56640.1 MAG: 4Fe-4S ferredoxin [Chloroflexi bacterium CG07_land_8_20_14_0_80_45_17]
MMPQIEIDKKKCTTPYECKKCLQICPQAVFAVAPTKIERFKETDPEDYEVQAVFRDKCTVYMDCVKACPTGAVTVKAGA